MFNWFKTVWSEKKWQLAIFTGLLAVAAYGTYTYVPTSVSVDIVTTTSAPTGGETNQVNSVTTTNNVEVKEGLNQDPNTENAASTDADVQ